MPEFNILYTALLIGGVLAFVMGVVAYLILAERKVSAWVQDRRGPNRVGPFGLLQPLADGGKMFLKEDVIPSHVDRIFFLLAPIVAFSTSLLAIAVVPVGGTKAPPPPAGNLAEFEKLQSEYQHAFSAVLVPGLDVGILYVFAIGSLAVYGVILAGWSANNKYSLLGSLRSSAQIISYEIPLGLSVVGVLLFCGSLNLETVVAWQQAHGWNVWFQPLAFLLFMTSVYAECNRLPFDLPEAEQQLVGGYHTEYSNSMKLGLMLLAEYAHMITTSFLMAIVFWGGWAFFGLEKITDSPLWATLIKTAILMAKMFAFVFLYLLIRWTIPRFRFDQLMTLAWKTMIPLALANLVGAMAVRQYGLSPWGMTLVSLGLFVLAGAISVRTNSSITAPKRRVVSLPPGLPAGVTYASR